MASVSTQPSAMQFTLTDRPHAAASDRVMWLSPALAAAYGVSDPPPPPGMEAWLEMLMMQPPLCWACVTL
jgi:hypothetical protein